MSNLAAIVPGDVVQIVDAGSDWYGCLLIVDEVMSWGVLAAVIMPAGNKGDGNLSLAYLRIKLTDLNRVGESKILLNDPREQAKENPGG